MNRILKLAGAAALASTILAAPAAAQPVPSTSAPLLANSAGVAGVYNQWKLGTVWFKGGVPKPAVAQLLAILRRAPADGIVAGPQLAAAVEAAARQAASGNPQNVAAADRAVSAAWVSYVQALKRPTEGMIYAFDVLKPQGTRTDQIVLAAASAPSLEQHLVQVSNVNHIYAAIRDAEWARMQSTGSTTPDTRVLLNLDRVRSIPAKGRFVLVDSASARLWMYENGVPVDSMKVIVGSKEYPTPLIASIMYYVTFNPYWNAPDHLVRGPIAQKTLAGGMKYFRDQMGYEVMADWTENSATIPAETIDWKAVAAGKVKLRIRQKPGKENFMGTLKFPFPNPEDIYLHDTPGKVRFKDASLAQSNGCVRLEDAARFGRWLLGREPVAPGTDPEIRVQVPNPVPIYLTYITAQPSGGQLTFLKDVYGWDRPGARVASTYVSPVSASR